MEYFLHGLFLNQYGTLSCYLATQGHGGTEGRLRLGHPNGLQR